jgi:ferredoxin-NADP reductase
MHVLFAGGVGITPMMSMIRTLADVGDKRPVILLYGSKDWDSITFREELEELKARLDLKVIHVLAVPPADWIGERGFISPEVLERHLPRPYAAHEYFICGPAVMMDAIERRSENWGYPCRSTIPSATVSFREVANAPPVCRSPGLSHGGDRDPLVSSVRVVARNGIADRAE